MSYQGQITLRTALHREDATNVWRRDGDRRWQRLSQTRTQQGETTARRNDNEAMRTVTGHELERERSGNLHMRRPRRLSQTTTQRWGETTARGNDSEAMRTRMRRELRQTWTMTGRERENDGNLQTRRRLQWPRSPDATRA